MTVTTGKRQYGGSGNNYLDHPIRWGVSLANFVEKTDTRSVDLVVVNRDAPSPNQ